MLLPDHHLRLPRLPRRGPTIVVNNINAGRLDNSVQRGMTLVFGALVGSIVTMVSDRLTTLGAPKHAGYDAQANKCIVLHCIDGLVLIGYTGRAHLDRVPTDQWMANVLLETAFAANPGLSIPKDVSGAYFPLNRERLATALYRLKCRLMHHPRGDEVELLIFGLKRRRGRLHQIVIKGTARRMAVMIPPWGCRKTGFASVGAAVPEDLLANLVNKPLNTFNVVKYASVLGDTIRAVADIEPTVGSDVMEVIATLNPPAIQVCYRPKGSPGPLNFGYMSGPPASIQGFTPWIIHPLGYVVPLVLTGGEVEITTGLTRINIKREGRDSLIYNGVPPILNGISQSDGNAKSGRYGAVGPQRRK